MTWTKEMPPWRKQHKNRKKTLRQAEQAGLITAAQRVRLQDESLATIRGLTAGRRARLIAEAAAYKAAYDEAVRLIADVSPAAGAWCSPECLAATGPACKCQCEGVNHGATSGLDPLNVWPTHTSMERRHLLTRARLIRRRLQKLGVAS